MWSLRWHFTIKSVTAAPYSIKSYSLSHSWTLSRRNCSSSSDGAERTDDGRADSVDNTVKVNSCVFFPNPNALVTFSKGMRFAPTKSSSSQVEVPAIAGSPVGPIVAAKRLLFCCVVHIMCICNICIVPGKTVHGSEQRRTHVRFTISFGFKITIRNE